MKLEIYISQDMGENDSVLNKTNNKCLLKM